MLLVETGVLPGLSSFVTRSSIGVVWCVMPAVLPTAGGVILSDAGASFADAVRSHGDPNVLAMSDLLLIVNTADMMCGPDGVPVSFVERLADVEARYGVGSRQAVDVGVMLGVLRRELEMRGVSVAAAERAGVERVGAVGESAESVEGAAVADATVDTDVSDTEGAADSL